MRITLVGSRHFGVTTLNMLREHGVEIAGVVVADAGDRLAAAARAAGIEVRVQADPKLVAASEIADRTDLIVTAHSHARISREALAAAKLGGIGYHPSLLPRHRGIAAIEWTIREGDPIAGGTVYHLADRMDAGAVAAQEWCFVKKGETARQLQALSRAQRWEQMPALVDDAMLDTYAVIGTYDEIAGKLKARYGALATHLEFTMPLASPRDADTLRGLVAELKRA